LIYRIVSYRIVCHQLSGVVVDEAGGAECLAPDGTSSCPDNSSCVLNDAGQYICQCDGGFVNIEAHCFCKQPLSLSLCLYLSVLHSSHKTVVKLSMCFFLFHLRPFSSYIVCFCCCVVSLVLDQKIGWEKRLRIDMLCFGWDIKRLTQSINTYH